MKCTLYAIAGAILLPAAFLLFFVPLFIADRLTGNPGLGLMFWLVVLGGAAGTAWCKENR